MPYREAGTRDSFGKLHGYCLKNYLSGYHEQWIYEHGVFVSGILITPDGRILQGSFSDGTLREDRICTIKYPDGIIEFGYFKGEKLVRGQRFLNL